MLRRTPFGVSAALRAEALAIPAARREKINIGLDYISEVLFSFINQVMRLAPIGTFGAVAYSVGSS